jgi:hypothetical protein
VSFGLRASVSFGARGVVAGLAALLVVPLAAVDLGVRGAGVAWGAGSPAAGFGAFWVVCGALWICGAL